jgi:hypothetical protein
MSAQFNWNWENKFKPWELVEYIKPSALRAVDPTTVVGQGRAPITQTCADWMVNFTLLTHRQTVLLPYAACEPLLKSLRRLCFLDYWLVEEDVNGYNRLIEDDTVEQGDRHKTAFIYDFDCIWNLSFLDWTEAYDPKDTQANAIIINGPPETASVDLVAAWPYLKRSGGLVAVIPQSDLLDKTESGKLVRRFCKQHELMYGVPRPGLIDKSYKVPVVVIFGNKH